MPIEHRVSLVPAIPCVEWIMGEDKPCPIANVLLLVVLYLNELIAEVVVIEELVIVVSQYQVLLPLEVLQQANRCLCIVAGYVPQDENMIIFLHYGVPVLRHSVVIVLRPIQLVVGKGQLVLCAPDWVRVSLVPKVDVRYVEIVRHSISFVVFTINATGDHRPNLS